MSALLTSDIHMTDNPRDSYRWNLFPWLAEQIKKLNVNILIIGGDLTDGKDRHSAKLTNKMIEGFSLLNAEIYINKGNHDFIDAETPFFKFITKMGVHFIIDPKIYNLKIKRETSACLFLPNTKTWKEDWADANFNQFDYIFAHQTFEGIKAENGFPIPGIPTDIFDETKAKIYCGDIHMPQIVGPVEYIGSPYRTHFGDTYNPRVIYVNDVGKASDLHFPCPNKHLVTIRVLDDLKRYKDIEAGDQVKIRVKLKRSEYHEWKAFREEVKEFASEKEWDVFSIELSELTEGRVKLDSLLTTGVRKPREVITEFARAKDLSDEQLQIGLSLLP